MVKKKWIPHGISYGGSSPKRGTAYSIKSFGSFKIPLAFNFSARKPKD